MKWLLVFALLLIPTTAQATPIKDQTGNVLQPYTDWTLTNKMPAPQLTPITLVWDSSECGDAGACAWHPNSISLRSGPENAWLRDRLTVLHEVGHIIDYQIMTPNARFAFRAILHDPRPWDFVGFNSPHEKFAEAYAQCAMLGPYGKTPIDWNWGYGFDPHYGYRTQECLLIQRVLARPRYSIRTS